MEFIFTNNAKKKFVKLDLEVQSFVIRKLKIYKSRSLEELPLVRIKGGFTRVSHRLRIGSYRLIVKVMNKNKILVVDLGHRKDVYKIY